MDIIDVHVHIFPDKIARKASGAIGTFYELESERDGTLENAVKGLDKAGIDRFFAHSVATTPKQVSSINNFILEAQKQYPDRLIPFAALHPDVADMNAAVDSIIERGFRGIKIHPDIQGFMLDDKNVLDMFACLEGRLPVLIHTGDYRYDNSGPDRMNHVLDLFPNLTVICAHLGGWGEWERAYSSRLPGRKNAYTDISSTLYKVDNGSAVRMVKKWGIENVFYGSDYPLWDTPKELKMFMELPLDDDEKEMILHKNAERVFDL